jgi:hypothetical protein
MRSLCVRLHPIIVIVTAGAVLTASSARGRPLWLMFYDLACLLSTTLAPAPQAIRKATVVARISCAVAFARAAQ